MVRHPIPTYRFEFYGGLAESGRVGRICSGVDGDTTHRIHYRLNDLPLAGSLSRQMPALVADLIDVAAATYISDRLARREQPHDPRPVHDRWHRRIHVSIPVRHPYHWRRPDVVECLVEILGFLTDDRWTFEFTDRLQGPRQSEVQAIFPWRPPHPMTVILNSGGLDSLAGLIDRLSVSDAATVMPVTVGTNRRVPSATRQIIEELGKAASPAGPLLQPARLHISVSSGGRPRDEREHSHRARAMLFLAAGVCASVSADTDRLYVCENGVGAISLPMSPDHWGAHASKAMHPKTLTLFAKLASFVLDRPIAIENIGLFATKGELVRKLDRDRFAAAARRTVTCDRATYLSHGHACGACTSCLLRRAALVAEGLDVLVDGQATIYEIDVCDPAMPWERDKTVHLIAMRNQVEHLRSAIEVESKFARLEHVFPALFDVVDLAQTLGHDRAEVERRLLRLYRAYVHEFDALVAKIDHPGWGRQASITELTRAVGIAAFG